MTTQAKRIVWIAGALCVLLGGAAIWSRSKSVQLTITNSTDDDIVTATVALGPQVVSLGAIYHGASKSVAFRGYTDAHWTLDTKWRSGKADHRDFGYVTSGMSSRDQAIFAADRKFSFENNPY